MLIKYESFTPTTFTLKVKDKFVELHDVSQVIAAVVRLVLVTETLTVFGPVQYNFLIILSINYYFL